MGPFHGFLITRGFSVAVWSAIFVADISMRKKDYAEAELFDGQGRYGAWNFRSISLTLVGSVVGWGFVTNPFASWLSWQGYFMGAIGGKSGAWAYANVGVIFALLVGFFGQILLSHRSIRAQEARS